MPKDESKGVKKLPKDQAPSEDIPKAMEQKQPKSFTASTEGVNEIVQCINEVVGGKYSKQAIFNALNEHLKPIF